MHFDPTLTLGSLLIVATTVCSVWWATARVYSRFETMTQTIADHEKTLVEHTAQLRGLAESFVRLDEREANHWEAVIATLKEIKEEVKGARSDIAGRRSTDR